MYERYATLLSLNDRTIGFKSYIGFKSSKAQFQTLSLSVLKHPVCRGLIETPSCHCDGVGEGGVEKKKKRECGKKEV